MNNLFFEDKKNHIKLYNGNCFQVLDDLKKENLNFCSVARKAKDIADQLGVNQNTLRSHYLYPMIKNGKLIRPKGVSLYIKAN